MKNTSVLLAKSRELLETTVLQNPWIPEIPTPRQAVFLTVPVREAFYGGAAGGGKSSALLMAALQFVHIPGYRALLLRRTYSDLKLPGALMDRANTWLTNTSAKWNDNEKTWVFPSGATVTFGYLETERDKYRYQGSEYQFVGFDELTHFPEDSYRYLFSRLRRLKDVNIPIRMRSASNPGGYGHEWVKQRMIVEGRKQGRMFIPARLVDNPHLDAAEYADSLLELDPVTRQQLLNGDWDVIEGGTKFRREWFDGKIIASPPPGLKLARYWDLAATEPKKGSDPDYTVGALVGEKDGQYWVLDIRRIRATPQGVEALIRQTAQADGKAVKIYMEQEPGSSGVNTIDYYQRKVLLGFSFKGVKSTGSKEVRANPVSSAAEAGNIFIVQGTWVNTLLDELVAFPNGNHDDQVDAVSGAVAALTQPTGRIVAF